MNTYQVVANRGTRSVGKACRVAFTIDEPSRAASTATTPSTARLATFR
jgi:hypothetical protein